MKDQPTNKCSGLVNSPLIMAFGGENDSDNIQIINSNIKVIQETSTIAIFLNWLRLAIESSI
jgi:hypothetical protein